MALPGSGGSERRNRYSAVAPSAGRTSPARRGGPPYDPHRTLMATCLVVLTVIAIVAALKLTEAVSVPAAIAALAAVVLAPAARALERLRFPPPLAAFCPVAAVILALLGSIYALLPQAEVWRFRAPFIARRIERSLRDLTENVSESTGLEGAVPEDAETVMQSSEKLLADVAVNAPALAVGLTLGSFLTFFLIMERDRVGRGLLLLGAMMGRSAQVGRAMRDVRTNVGRFLFAITCINTCLGLATWGVLAWFGLPNPGVWGALMGLLNFVPYLGPAAMNVVILAVGIVSFPNEQDAIWPVLAVGTLNVIEGNLITPGIVGRRARVSAVSVLVAVSFGYWLWGAPGALIATPALIVGGAIARRFVPTTAV